MENRIQDKKEAEEKTEKEADMMDDETSQNCKSSQLKPETWLVTLYVHASLSDPKNT